MSTQTTTDPDDRPTTPARRPLTWFVTGSSRGFGREWADAALDRGDRVVATARETERLEPLVRRHGDAVLPLSLDVTDRGAVLAAVQQGVDHFGSLDVVVNNAGLMTFKPIEEQTGEDWTRILDVDLIGAFYFIKQAFLRMKEGGAVVNIASVHAVETEPMVAPYAAAKAALLSLTRSAAIEGKPKGIRVNGVHPTVTLTPMAFWASVTFGMT